MPRKPEKSRDDAIVQLLVRMPGWLKNKIAKRSAQEGVSMNKWAAAVLFRALTADSFPAPPPAEYPLPTLEESIRIQIRGDSLFEPCGKPAPCEREEAGVSELQGMAFCNHCQVRIQ